MPSRDHEIYVELFRQRPALALALLRACAAIELPGTAELGTIDLSQVTPTEFRADAVVVVRDEARAVIAGVVIEVQTSRDRAKRRTWPVYVTALRASLGCPVVLLVLAPDPDVAAIAREPIALGHPGFVLTPVVISAADIQRLTEPAAIPVPELAVLSARAHPEPDVVRAAVAAIDALPAETRELYWQFVMTALPALVRQAMEAEMTPDQIKAAIEEMSFELGFDKGQAVGLEQGRAVGLEQGRAEGLCAAVHELVRLKLGAPMPELAARLARLDEPALTALIAELGQAGDGNEVRAVLARVDTV